MTILRSCEAKEPSGKPSRGPQRLPTLGSPCRYTPAKKLYQSTCLVNSQGPPGGFPRWAGTRPRSIFLEWVLRPCASQLSRSQPGRCRDPCAWGRGDAWKRAGRGQTRSESKFKVSSERLLTNFCKHQKGEANESTNGENTSSPTRRLQ